MKKWLLFVSIPLISITSFFVEASFSAGKSRPEMGGWGADGAFAKMFDRSKIIFLTGTVEGVKSISPLPGMTDGVSAALTTRDGPVELILGPKWFINNQSMIFLRNDMVEARGVKIMLHKKTFFVPARVIKGGCIMELRNDDGIPVWDAVKRR